MVLKNSFIALMVAMAFMVISCSAEKNTSASTSSTTGKTSANVEKLECDVLVIGAGGAGLSAALTAKQGGANVIVLEKMAGIGGATAMAGGGTNATGSKWQIEDGIQDSPEFIFMDLMKNGHFKSDGQTLWLYANTVGAAFDWLVSEDGAAVPYTRTKPSPSAEHRVGRNYSASGAGAGAAVALNKHLQSLGVETMLNTRATELKVDNGKVVGAKAEAEGKSYDISAKAVIIATGGYGADASMIPENISKLPYAGAIGATGDGLKMARAIGAGTINLGEVNIQPHSIVLPNGRGQHTYPGVLRVYGTTGGFLVNQNGERFTNERGAASVIRDEMMKNEHTYLIMDETGFKAYTTVSINAHNFTQANLDEWLSANGSKTPVFAHGETLDELAATVGIPADKLKSTAERFNGFAANGKDTDYGRNIAAPLANEGPYYLVEQNLRYYATLGGLHINNDMAVLNEKGDAIPGLFAAGEVVGGVLGDIYAPGALFGWVMTSGHNAGLAVIKAIK